MLDQEPVPDRVGKYKAQSTLPGANFFSHSAQSERVRLRAHACWHGLNHSYGRHRRVTPRAPGLLPTFRLH